MTTAPDQIADITVVLVLQRHRPTADEWAELFATDEELQLLPVVVLYDESAEGAQVAIASRLPRATLLRLPDDTSTDKLDITKAISSAFDAVTTRYFCLTALPKQIDGYSDGIKDYLLGALARVEAIKLTLDIPILLYTRNQPTTAARAYLWHVLSRQSSADLSPVLRDYLGYLALASGSLSLEGVDANSGSGEIELFARVSHGRLNTVHPPAWKYRLAVVDPRRNVHAEATAAVSERINNRGERRWENVYASVPLIDVPDGNHKIMIGLVTQFEPLDVLRPLPPRPGVLASARTVLLEPDAGGITILYLVHTTRKAPHTWIMVQRGRGLHAQRRWNRSMLRKDIRLILRDRSARRMRLARLARLLTLPIYRHKEIWLVGEREDTAQDNGFHLFNFIRRAKPDRRVYYVINKKSPQYPRVAGLGNIVQHSSLRHRLYMLHASVLANAYSIKHMIPRTWNSEGYVRHISWRVGALRIYLKHGIHVSANAVKRGNGGYDLYVSASRRETEALRESSGYTNQIVETGMPRYDALQPGQESRRILFMPTWRRYLVPRLFGPSDEALVPFMGSTYQQFIESFLNSPRLREMLVRHGYWLQFLPHYNLADHLTEMHISNERIEWADTQTNSFQDLIRGCDAFITDHSSVHFDVAYLGTPIIYTHFDRDEYIAGHASVSWFEPERDGFGPVVHTLDETLDALEALLERGCAPDPKYAARAQAMFAYRDKNNSARVVEAVDRRLSTSRLNP